MVDLLKVIAAQVILWHHFCRYGPLARTLQSSGHEWVSWIGNDGRYAVQVFLVISGFLAARSVGSLLGYSSITELAQTMQRTWINRMWRLGKPYWLMLLFAILIAALSRLIQPDPDTPTTPNLWQIASHFLFVQDIFTQDTLSTGVWYVAIDLQLSLLFLSLLFASSAITSKTGLLNPANAERVIEIFVWILLLTAVFIFNLSRSLDIWAIYFFGAFGLGAATALRLTRANKKPIVFWITVICVFGIALAIEWRPGLLVALVCAALLWWADVQEMVSLNKLHPLNQVLHKLSGNSYALFLFHYPVILWIGTIIDFHWPKQVLPAMLGLLASWAVSMLGASGGTRALKQQNRLQKAI
jgi:peptidoglycan/LPS O-acetylase OafA/YrhL